MSLQTEILTVSQLTHAIKERLETAFPVISLQGEVSNFKRQASGHLYFSLKDQNAQISAVMFRGSASAITRLPKDGDQVVVQAELNVYPPAGRYQIVVKKLELAGLGDLLLKLEELKVKLHKMGYFKSAHKKPLPKFPKKIGVVTSPTGAVIQDILNVLSRRFSNFHLILNPVKVQGEGAAAEIAKAIEDFNRYELVDVIIVGRGGGSIEDLWAFNEESVAEAIFQSQIPIISAVGHETDHCIADYVADVRAPTPSAAAEIVIAEQAKELQQLALLKQRLCQTVLHTIRGFRHRLEGFSKQPIFSSPYTLIGQWMQKTDDLRGKLDNSMKQLLQQKKLKLEGKKGQVATLQPKARLAQFKERLFQLDKGIHHHFLQAQEKRRTSLKHVQNSLKAIDPKKLLKKGYSILFSEKKHSVITSVQDLKKGEKIQALTGDGEILSQILEVTSHE